MNALATGPGIPTTLGAYDVTTDFRCGRRRRVVPLALDSCCNHRRRISFRCITENRRLLSAADEQILRLQKFPAGDT